MQKILGKYEIIEFLGNDAYYAKLRKSKLRKSKIESKEFRIIKKAKGINKIFNNGGGGGNNTQKKNKKLLKR